MHTEEWNNLPELQPVTDDEDDADEEDLDVSTDHWQRLCDWVYEQVDEMYAHCYKELHAVLPHGPSHLQHLLTKLKHSHPDAFHQELRINPTTFDALVACISPDTVFSNNSNNSQMPVEEQLAITLYRFGHDSSAASLQAVANWAGVGKGTVTICT